MISQTGKKGYNTISFSTIKTLIGSALFNLISVNKSLSTLNT